MAFDRAPKTSPVYLPSAQVVREIALAVPSSSRPIENRELARLQEPCALGHDNPFRVLAEQWEAERIDSVPNAAKTAEQRLETLSRMLTDALGSDAK